MDNRFVDIVMEQINDQIQAITQSNGNYKGYRFIIAAEQMFNTKEADRNAIHIVVRFSPSTIDFGQVVLPITITAVSEADKLGICQRLLFDLANGYTQTKKDIGDDVVRVVYQTPTVIANFDDIGYSLRSLLSMSGVYIIGLNSDTIESAEITVGGETVKFDAIKIDTSYSVQIDSQAYSATNDIMESLGKSAVFTVSIVCFATDNAFERLALAMEWGDYQNAPDGVTTKFELTLEYKSVGRKTAEFTLINRNESQSKAELPIITMTFAR